MMIAEIWHADSPNRRRNSGQLTVNRSLVDALSSGSPYNLRRPVPTPALRRPVSGSPSHSPPNDPFIACTTTTTSADDRFASVHRFRCRCRSSLPLFVTAPHCCTRASHSCLGSTRYFCRELFSCSCTPIIGTSLADILLFIVLMLNCNNHCHKCFICFGVSS